MKKVIVSRHLGAVEWLGQILWPDHRSCVQTEGATPKALIKLDYSNPEFPEGLGVEEIPVLTSATPDSVRDAVVYGNVPLDMAAEAAMVHAILFPPGKAPRGAECSAQEMTERGAFLASFVTVPAAVAEGVNDFLGDNGCSPITARGWIMSPEVRAARDAARIRRDLPWDPEAERALAAKLLKK